MCLQRSELTMGICGIRWLGRTEARPYKTVISIIATIVGHDCQSYFTQTVLRNS